MIIALSPSRRILFSYFIHCVIICVKKNPRKCFCIFCNCDISILRYGVANWKPYSQKSNIRLSHIAKTVAAGIILCMRPANEKRRYVVTSSLIDWAHTQNDPCCCWWPRDAMMNGLLKAILIHKFGQLIEVPSWGIPPGTRASDFNLGLLSTSSWILFNFLTTS